MHTTRRLCQFDQPVLQASPATPSCCCCCCCLATIVAAPVMMSIEANRQAKQRNRPRAIPTILAVGSLPAGVVVAFIADGAIDGLIPSDGYRVGVLMAFGTIVSIGLISLALVAGGGGRAESSKKGAVLVGRVIVALPLELVLAFLLSAIATPYAYLVFIPIAAVTGISRAARRDLASSMRGSAN